MEERQRMRIYKSTKLTESSHHITKYSLATLTTLSLPPKREKKLTFIAPTNPPNAAILAASSALPPLGSRWLNVPSGCRDGDGILLGLMRSVLYNHIIFYIGNIYDQWDAKTLYY